MYASRMCSLHTQLLHFMQVFFASLLFQDKWNQNITRRSYGRFLNIYKDLEPATDIWLDTLQMQMAQSMQIYRLSGLSAVSRHTCQDMRLSKFTLYTVNALMAEICRSKNTTIRPRNVFLATFYWQSWSRGRGFILKGGHFQIICSVCIITCFIFFSTRQFSNNFMSYAKYVQIQRSKQKKMLYCNIPTKNGKIKMTKQSRVLSDL